MGRQSAGEVAFDDAMAQVSEWRSQGRVPELTAALRNPIGNDDLNIRTLAARALGDLEAVAAVGELGRLVADDESEMARIVSVEALGKIGSSEGVSAVVPAMSDSSPHVRMHAARALGRLRANSEVPTLVAALRDSSWKVRVWSAEALEVLGAVEARSDIERQRGREWRPRARRLMGKAIKGLGGRQ